MSIELPPDLKKHFVSSQDIRRQQSRLHSCLPEVDAFFGGGLPANGLCEFGIPMGRGGRVVVLSYIAPLTQQRFRVLWINGHATLTPNAPAWFSKNIHPDFLYFSQSGAPLQELKQAFLKPLFKLIVLDIQPRQLKLQDYAFLDQRARINHQAIFIIQNRTLNNASGNVWAKSRVNLFLNPSSQRLYMRTIRGTGSRETHIQWQGPENSSPQQKGDAPC